MTAAKPLWRNEHFKTAVAIILVIAIVLGLFLGLRTFLNTPDPALTVVSGSMSIPYGASDNDFWRTIATPFDRTLSVGDIIIIQGVNPADLNANYPNSDIIVYHEPGDLNTLIVHRIVSKQEINGVWYFQTKGDGNGQQWPAIPSSDQYDSHTIWNSPQYSSTGIPQSYVVGKVVLRIPWFGWVTIFVKDNPWGLPIIIVLIILVAILEFVLPELRKKTPANSTPSPSQKLP